MDPITALARGLGPAGASLDGHPVAWRRTEPGWDTGWRVLDRHLFHLVDDGDMQVEHGRLSDALVGGDALLIPPGTRFRLRAGRRAPAYWRLRLDLPAAWDGERIRRRVRGLEPVVTTLLGELAEPPGPVRDAAVRGGLLLLLAPFRRGQRDPGRSLDPARMARLERLAAEDPRATPADLARALGLSHDYATRLIRAATGLPPRRWLLERRMHALAADLMDGDRTLAELAERYGYGDLRLLGRQFRQVMGLPPGRFRARCRDG
jgi:AraC-like DNA-binding protein